MGSVRAAIIAGPKADIHEIETNSDQFGIVVGATSQEEAQKYFNEHDGEQYTE